MEEFMLGDLTTKERSPAPWTCLVPSGPLSSKAPSHTGLTPAHSQLVLQPLIRSRAEVGKLLK